MTNKESEEAQAEWEYLERWLKVNRWQRELAMQELEIMKSEGGAIPQEGGLIGLQNRQEGLNAVAKTLLGRMEEMARTDSQKLAPLTRGLIRTELYSLLGEFGDQGSLKSSQHGHEYWIQSNKDIPRGIKLAVMEANRIVKIKAETLPAQAPFAEIEINDIREIPAKVEKLKAEIRRYLSAD